MYIYMPETMDGPMSTRASFCGSVFEGFLYRTRSQVMAGDTGQKQRSIFGYSLSDILSSRHLQQLLLGERGLLLEK